MSTELQIVGGCVERKPILVIGDGAVATGFATVLRSIFRHLTQKYEIHQLATNYRGDPHDWEWKLYPAHTGGDPYGVKRLRNLVEALRPSFIFILFDVWAASQYMLELAPITDRIPVVVYCPIDGGPINPAHLPPLAAAKKLVVYTRAAKNEFDRSISNIHRRGCAAAFPPVDIVPHGVNRADFHPYEDESCFGWREGKRHAKRLLFGDDDEFVDSFIVLNANRNQPRKRIDITMKAFSQFAKGKPSNVKLYLHMGIEDIGWNVITLAERLGIDDRLILTDRTRGIPSVDTNRLNLIYNACDVGLNTSTGESWGLVAFEHAATGAAQIVPRHSGCAELWDGSALMLDPVLTLTDPVTLTEAHLVTAESVAAALECLYQDPDYREAMALAAYKNATRPEYDWSAIARRWDEIFDAAKPGRTGPEM